MNQELPAHRSGKAAIAAFWQRREDAVRNEAGCDVFVWRVDNGHLQFVFSEYAGMARKGVIRKCAPVNAGEWQHRVGVRSIPAPRPMLRAQTASKVEGDK